MLMPHIIPKLIARIPTPSCWLHCLRSESNRFPKQSPHSSSPLEYVIAEGFADNSAYVMLMPHIIPKLIARAHTPSFWLHCLRSESKRVPKQPPHSSSPLEFVIAEGFADNSSYPSRYYSPKSSLTTVPSRHVLQSQKDSDPS
jgi:hypothetical protein